MSRPARTSNVSPYKGTFELSRQDAKRLRVASVEHEVSITRLVQAAILTTLDDPATLSAVIERAATLAEQRGQP